MVLIFGREPIDRPDLHLESERLVLRPPMLADFEAWAAIRASSRDFLTPWEPTWAVDELSRRAYRARIRRYAQDLSLDAAYPFFLFRHADGALLGGLTLTQVRRGAAAMAALGYWMGAPYAGQGYMTEAVERIVQHAFEALRLRRIEAACVPENAASMRLLGKAGFSREGHAREYLEINGRWRDHILYARLIGDRAETA